MNGKLAYQVCLQKYENLSLTFELKPGINKISFTVLNHYPGSEDQFRAALNEIEFIPYPEYPKLTFENIHFVHRGTKQSAIIKKKGTILVDSPEPGIELTIKAKGNLNMQPSEKRQA